MSALRVLHVFPDSALQDRHAYLGSTKDVRCRTQYFADRGLDVRELPHERSGRALLGAIRATDLNQYDAVLLENLVNPFAVRELRKTAPHLRIGFRPINAELLHRIDMLRSAGLSASAPQRCRDLLVRSASDALYANWSHVIFPISDWEAEHYWQRFTTPTAVRSSPFFLSDRYLPAPGAAKKELTCVCLTSSAWNPVIALSAQLFIEAVEALPKSFPWRFVMTGDADMYKVPSTSRIEVLGFVDDPNVILSQSRATAILSRKGYGFKTKILEAVVNRSYVLVHPALYRRLPSEILPSCIQVPPGRADSFAAALEACQEEMPDTAPNDRLRERAYSALDWFFEEQVGASQS